MNELNRLLPRAILLGVVSAALMILSIMLRDEIWNSRTIALVFIWLMGGFLGTFAASIAMRLASRFWEARTIRLMRAIAFLPAFIVAGALVFYLATLWQTGFELHQEHPIRSLLFGSLQLMALFVYTMSHYMLPWMAPAMMVAGYALLPNLPSPPEA